MPNFNKVILIGHMTRDPELKTLPSGTSLAAFGIAVNHKWKSKGGEKKEEVSFIDCAVMGARADALCQYFKKGDAILIEGRIRQETWEAKDGGKRSKLSVMADSWEFVGGKKSDATAVDDAPAGDKIPF